MTIILEMDAVQAAGFITEKKTVELVDKIAAFGGSNRAELLKMNLVHFNTTKHSNENIYYNVYAIGEAILSGKKLSFLYFDYDERGERVFRKESGRYIVNPIATVFSNDNYYLLCYHDKHDNAASYRVDCMLNQSERMCGIIIADCGKQSKVGFFFSFSNAPYRMIDAKNPFCSVVSIFIKSKIGKNKLPLNKASLTIISNKRQNTA